MDDHCVTELSPKSDISYAVACSAAAQSITDDDKYNILQHRCPDEDCVLPSKAYADWSNCPPIERERGRWYAAIDSACHSRGVQQHCISKHLCDPAEIMPSAPQPSQAVKLKSTLPSLCYTKLVDGLVCVCVCFLGQASLRTLLYVHPGHIYEA